MTGKRIRSVLLILCLCIGFNLTGCQDSRIYAKEENWAYLKTDVSNPEADIFFICPSVYSSILKTKGDRGTYC